jgi:hypothetical protein
VPGELLEQNARSSLLVYKNTFGILRRFCKVAAADAQDIAIKIDERNDHPGSG